MFDKPLKPTYHVGMSLKETASFEASPFGERLRSCVFFRHVAEQAALARHSSSRAGCQAEWLFSGMV